jgi:CubicO group peptidase (beta-lactamase class C family)
MRDRVLMPLGMTSSRIASDLDHARVAKPHDENGVRIPGKYVTPPDPQEQADGIARYGAAAMLMTTPTDYATFLLALVNPKPADAFRLSEASLREMLRPQVQKSETAWEGLAWHLEQHDGIPLLFTHAGQDAGYYCITAGSTGRRSGLMVLVNGDSYLPFLTRLLADPAGPPPPLERIWPDFAQRFFAAQEA